MGAKHSAEPSTGRQLGVGAGLLLIDLAAIAWLLYGYGITGWADSYDQVNAPEAPRVARQAMWLLALGAAASGGGLLALRWRIAGTVQLVVLGCAAAAFACLATPR
ncbi:MULTISPECIES: hypothetical protein [Streptomyces]|uniref:DUF998 domain-containing protein n=1 Tax=Streptomyces desertarenae TaxID=2666184 RepID=A0ABW4PP60_9ACTN